MYQLIIYETVNRLTVVSIEYINDRYVTIDSRNRTLKVALDLFKHDYFIRFCKLVIFESSL